MGSFADKPPRADAALNQAEISESDLPLLETPGGREDVTGASHRGTLLDQELREENAPAFAQREFTGTPAAAVGAEETDDGFDETEEAVRHRAEDIPTGESAGGGELPVFERSLTEPKT